MLECIKLPKMVNYNSLINDNVLIIRVLYMHLVWFVVTFVVTKVASYHNT